ncbi:DNA-methyltransferase [Halapricum hydrolyticum]|uniref:Type II methyltransferase n=1 Tax=Halapricum hydrolyticum TaxID=2979991 RepID=A0AAE3I9B5_9EURY|nr:site-specific DNA-methyltransferase [Halapricum hydrolyticum]MCU4716608.1 site-specific DNA-methyltransferase [Halapricum hydrolyticum]MCU4725787.1 site-specific DNA-methyltransferase [Halapricum hydrolyticum]
MIEESEIDEWLNNDDMNALIEGDSREVLRSFPAESIDCVVTSPPYWGVREYSGDSQLGNEETVEEYIDNLAEIINELKRVLKPEGSFWLNIGDTYQNKDLVGVPWRTALALKKRQDWILRNDVIWNKVKGNPSSATDRLRVMHEYIFHFVKKQKYYYDMDSIREDPDFEVEIRENGDVVSPTGVSGTRYRKQIKENDTLNKKEKENALEELERHLEMLKNKEIKDFRMVIRDEQRSTHGNSEELSGRARELAENGFYFLRYNAEGAAPGNIWDIVPEDQHRDDTHCAVYPAEICEIPIRATCPPDGVVLDPFVGTGTTVVAANRLKRKAIGIDASSDYLKTAKSRLADGVQTKLR